MKLLEKYRVFLSKPNVAPWYIFGLFALVIFAKCVLFNWFCYSGIEDNYFMALLMSLPQKIVSALFIAAFVFVTKRPIWTIVVNLLIDTWIIANLFYFKANGCFLSYEVMTMVDNMDGFWDSLLSYMGWDIAVFPLITLVYSLLIPYSYPVRRQYGWMAAFIAFALCLNIGDQALHKYHKASSLNTQPSTIICLQEILPFSHVFVYADAEWVDYNQWAKQYVRKFSIVSYFPSCLLYRCLSPLEKIEMIDIDERRLRPFLSDTQEKPVPRTNVVFILFESLESWPLNSIEGVNFLPSLNAIAHGEHALCCRNLRPQVMHGNSADGQLIDITGLLPITDGVVCNSFYNNTYPSFAECYPHSAIINPWPGVWKQDRMTRAYHFRDLIEPRQKEKWTDGDIADRIIQYMDTAIQPFSLLGITISSHVPFTYGADHPKYTIPGMPSQLNNYLNCLAYADSCIGAIYRHILSSEQLATNTTLVISGDHTIFRSYNKTFDTYAQTAQLDFRTTKTYTPLIIYSPSIDGNVQISDTCYQMDIYPTLMSLIDCQDYYWKGFGANLLDPSARHNRPVSEEEAYQLSNQLIRSSWFSPTFSSNRVEYIAHAGGVIDGYRYTDCLEAVEHALASGINSIELDLCLTSDSCLVAAHDWDHFHEITGFSGDSAAVPLSEFRQRKIYGKYTPITFEMIDSLMTIYPNMYLMTDKISSPRLLSSFRHRDRIMVEAFSYDDYSRLDTMGFCKVFYSAAPKTKRRVLYNRCRDWLTGKTITPVPARYTFFYRNRSTDYHRLSGDEFAVFSVPNKHAADSLAALDQRIKYIYIDEVE